MFNRIIEAICSEVIYQLFNFEFDVGLTDIDLSRFQKKK